MPRNPEWTEVKVKILRSHCAEIYRETRTWGEHRMLAHETIMRSEQRLLAEPKGGFHFSIPEAFLLAVRLLKHIDSRNIKGDMRCGTTTRS